MTETDAPPMVLNPTPTVEVRKVGREGNAVVVADDVLLDPDAFAGWARRQTFGPPPPPSRYPGRVAPVPDLYPQMLFKALQMPMSGIFGVPPHHKAMIYGFFGLATVPPKAMLPLQIAPHTDSHRLHSYATVHYLGGDVYGGTAFYRHKATGLERVPATGSDRFVRMRRQELADNEGRPPAVIRELYEEIAFVEPRYNRLVLYPANLLHSAKMADDVALSDDPRMGRLTANLFYNTQA